MRKLFLIPVFLLRVAFAQDTQVLTYEAAVATMLENNLGISIAKNNAQAAANLNTAGNAGMLPQVSFNASGSYANNTTNQDYSNGLTVNRSGVVSNGLNSGILLSWTIFDGMRMFAVKNRLNASAQASEYQLKQQVENTITQVSSAYYELVRQKQQIMSIKENILVFEERLRIAELRLNIGKSAKTDVLQAKVDLNEQKSRLINSETLYKNAQADLNQLLGKPVETGFEVDTTIAFIYNPSYNELKTSYGKKNNTLLLAEKNIDLAMYMKREIEAMRYPWLTLNTSYNFSRSTNAAGLVLLNQNLGLNAGFTLSWTLFNGFKTQTQVKNAKLVILNSQLILDDTKRKTEAALLQAWRNYESAKAVLALEEESYLLARENMTISLERFKLGDMTTVEFKQVQISLQDVQTRMVDARYAAKLAEVELMRLNGDLVK